jgi:hypothetical protein
MSISMENQMLKFLVVIGMLGCSVDPSTDTREQWSLSPNPCTAVALTAPVGNFAGSVGTPIALSASATCPAGQVPEFQFWGKRVGDQDWTILTEYVPGSASYTPIASDVLDGSPNYCFSVVARAIGAPENYQARSGGTCGTIVAGTEMTPNTSITVQVPLFDPINNSVTPGRFFPTNGAQGVVAQLPSLPVGATITRIRARVRDNAIGPTVLFLGFSDQLDDGFGTFVPPSEDSDGSGSFQTLDLGGMSVTVVSLHTYQAGVFVHNGTAPAAVYAIEVTYIP